MKYIPALRFKSLTRFFDRFISMIMAEKVIKMSMVDMVALKDGERVLDFGCGTGTLTILIKQSVRQIQVYGVDVDAAILEIARKKIGEHSGDIYFQQYDGHTLPYGAAYFDKVLSTLVFHHLSHSQKQRALFEIYRVLKPGGEIHIVDFGKARNILARGYFFIWQLMDGIPNTQDNIKGNIPIMISEIGFQNVIELKRFKSLAGSLSYYRGQKPINTCQ